MNSLQTVEVHAIFEIKGALRLWGSRVGRGLGEGQRGRGSGVGFF